MFIFRWLSLILVVLAVMLMGADVVSTLERGGMIVVRSFDQILMLFGADTSTWAQAGLPPAVVAGGRTVLSWPAWLVLGVPGGVIAALVPEKQKRQAPAPPPIERL